MIEKILSQIGLSEKEITIYIVSLQYGLQPASIIATRAHINRTTVYDIFSNLIEKGLAHKIEKAGTTYFEVLDPQNLIAYLEREKEEFVRKTEKQKQEIEQIIPALKSLEYQTSTKPKVKFFEGERGIREAYEDTLTSSESIRAYANVETMHEGLPYFFPEYYKRRAEAKLFIQAICPDNKLSKERQKRDNLEMREIRFVDKKEYEFSPEINIYDDKVLIVSWKEKMATLITSKETANFHKKMFDLLWNKLPRTKHSSKTSSSLH